MDGTGNSLSVVVVQMCSGNDVHENLEQAESLLAEVTTTDLIVLPECFALFGGDIAGLGENNQVVRKWMSELAKEKSAWLIGGSIPHKLNAHEKSRDSCFVYSPQGNEEKRYDKIHLFDVDVQDQTKFYRESDDYSAGHQAEWVDMGIAKTGLSICYDLRFPELFQLLRAQGASLIVVPSAFTKRTGEAHWEILLRARAIENQCFILAANQGGVHSNQRETWGHSMIVSPWGDVLAKAGTIPCVIRAELPLKQVEEVRQTMPCFDHKVLV